MTDFRRHGFLPFLLTWTIAAFASGAASTVPFQAAEPASFAPVEPGPGFMYVGTIRPKHAREIEASNWSVGAETMDRDYTIYRHWKDYLGPLGVKKARIQSGWAKTERRPGEYDWAWVDEIIFDMVDQGVEPWVCLCYGNPVYPGGGGTGLGAGLLDSDEALQAWDRYVAAMVDRYKQHVDEWEIWNEPGLRGKNPEGAYAGLLIRTAEIIRRQQPGARVVGFAMAGVKHDWVKAVLDRLKAQGKLELIDEVSYHPYSYNPDDSYEAVAKLRHLVASYSPTITLRQGENGAPSKRGSFGALSDYDWTEEHQAKWALRRLLGDLGRDIPSSYFAICDMQYPSRRNYKGLLAIHDDKTVDYPKPAYRAIQHLTAVFDNTVRRLPEFRANTEGDVARDHAIFAYRCRDGASLVTIWRSNDRPGRQPDLAPVDMTLPGLEFQDPVWVDLLSGRVYEIEPTRWKCHGSDTRFSGVPVYDSVVLLAERRTIDPPASSSP